jgi:putative ABC transport system permease protein
MNSTEGRPPSTIGRFHRALLRLLPFEFRAEFGRDMEEAFADEREDLLASRNRTQVFRFWLRTLVDFVRTAPREHWDILRQDVRAGARLMARSRGFAATAILTLALGVGGSTSIFSVVYGVVLRPLAFPQSERVVHVGWRGTEQAAAALDSVSFLEFQHLRDRCRSFEVIGAAQFDSLTSERGALDVRVPSPDWDSPLRAGGVFRTPMMASASLFTLVGASPVLGRLPDERDEEPGAAPVAVLSYSTWTSIYGRDPKVVGRTLVRHLGDGRNKLVTIVGVLAPDALKGLLHNDGLEPPAVASLDADMMRTQDDAGRESMTRFLSVYARLARGVTLDGARAELEVLTPSLKPGLPKTGRFTKASLRANVLRDEVVRGVREPLVAFLFAVLGLLLVACVNVSSLVLARTISRRREFAARFALGARPLRVARQLLTESAILAASGGVLGVALAWAGWRAFTAISPSMPRLNESAIGIPALLFAFAAVLLATCTSALVPALLSSRRSVVDGLRRAGGAAAAATGLSKPLALLAAAEVTVVLVLLAGTGLLVNSFARLVVFDLGFDARSIVMVDIENTLPPDDPSPPTPLAQSVAVLTARQHAAAVVGEEITRRVAAIPGVLAVGLTGDDPFGTPYRYSDARITDADPPVAADRRVASPTALDALGLHLASGRWFGRDDREGVSLVAVVNQTLAKKLWNGRNPVGERFLEGRRIRLVVGVVGDVHSFGARSQARPTFYVPTTQAYPDPVLLVVRKRPGATGVEKLLAAELATFGPPIKAGVPRQLEKIWWRQLSDARFLTLVVSVFSLLALAIALVGVHGVLRFSVAQRTREMGLRKALGAPNSALIALVVGQALRFTLPACVVGLVAAWAAAPAIRSLLFGITPTDPLTLLTATLLLVAAVVVASYFPARRGSAVDPSLSLKCE